MCLERLQGSKAVFSLLNIAVSCHANKCSKNLQRHPRESYSSCFVGSQSEWWIGVQKDPNNLPLMMNIMLSPVYLVLVSRKLLPVFLENCVCLLCQKVYPPWVFWYISKCCLNMELGQIWVENFCGICSHQLLVITAFMTGAQNLTMSSLVTGFRVIRSSFCFSMNNIKVVLYCSTFFECLL